MCVSCVPEECLMLMSTKKLMIDQPDVWEGGPCQECCASDFKESLSSLRFFSLEILFGNFFNHRCTSNSEFVSLL